MAEIQSMTGNIMTSHHFIINIYNTDDKIRLCCVDNHNRDYMTLSHWTLEPHHSDSQKLVTAEADCLSLYQALCHMESIMIIHPM